MPLLRGNLHTHTLLSDGLLSPDEVIARYRNLGYDFLAITDPGGLLGGDPAGESGFTGVRGGRGELSAA